MKSYRDLIKFGLDQFTLEQARRALDQCIQNPDKILLDGRMFETISGRYWPMIAGLQLEAITEIIYNSLSIPGNYFRQDFDTNPEEPLENYDNYETAYENAIESMTVNDIVDILTEIIAERTHET